MSTSHPSAQRPGTSPWRCTCGYPAESQQDLDEHTGIMAGLDREGAHQQL